MSNARGLFTNGFQFLLSHHEPKLTQKIVLTDYMRIFRLIVLLDAGNLALKFRWNGVRGMTGQQVENQQGLGL